MKIRLLLLLYSLFYCSLNAQISTNDLSKSYEFSNLSLINVANPGTYNLTVSGTNNATAVNDPSNAANAAIDLNGTNFNGGLHPTGTGDFTISFWIKTTATNAGRVLSQFNNVSTFNAGYFINYLSNGNLNFTGSFRYGSNYSTNGSVFSTAVNDGNWHHIVIVGRLVERNAGSPMTGFTRFNSYEYLIYKDNVFEEGNSTSEIQGVGQQAFLFSNSPELVLGSNSFNDEIDNYREYTRALSAMEIEDLANEFGTLSAQDFQANNEIRLYPNPTHDLLNITSQTDIKQVEIYSVTGQKLMTVTNNKTIDLSNLDTGIYLIAIADFEGNRTTSKFIKK